MTKCKCYNLVDMICSKCLNERVEGLMKDIIEASCGKEDINFVYNCKISDLIKKHFAGVEPFSSKKNAPEKEDGEKDE